MFYTKILIIDPDNEKIKQLNDIAENNVDIKGIGFYTLGKFRKNISPEEQDRYADLFRKYFFLYYKNITKW